MRGRFVAAALLASLLGCTGPAPQPAGLRLTQVRFSDLPQWNVSQAALASFQRSCAVLTAKPDSEAMGGYAGTVGDWRAVCGGTNSEARNFFEQNFTPFAIGGGEALFTGYYEPEIRGRSRRQGAFQTPVYGLPSDLVRVDLGAFNAKFQGEHVSGKVQGHTLLPYADRAEIAAKGAPNAPVLFYTDDPIAFFFLQIQGSGRVVLDDGGPTSTTARIAYAGENGQAYTAIGRSLIADGSLKREDVSLQSIRAWLKANPARAQSVMETNRSYIFFAQTPLDDGGLGPKGSLGVNLTPLASVAIDPRLNALGAPFYVAAEGGDSVHELAVAQDIGGAIRGPVRADIFFGFGPEAERRAGAMKGTGALYVLLPKALAAKIGDAKAYPP
jgi:membrane-bound lytic murein transglycosylase A